MPPHSFILIISLSFLYIGTSATNWNWMTVRNCRSGSGSVSSTPARTCPCLTWWSGGPPWSRASPVTSWRAGITAGRTQEVQDQTRTQRIMHVGQFLFLQVAVFFFLSASVVSSGSGGSSPENSNYLRVSAAFGQRRLSDNVLTAPGGRRLSGIDLLAVRKFPKPSKRYSLIHTKQVCCDRLSYCRKKYVTYL